MRAFSYLVMFAFGAGLGIWFGVNHPQLASDVAYQEQQETEQLKEADNKAKLEMVERLLSHEINSTKVNLHRLLEDERARLQSATQPAPTTQPSP